MNAGDNVDITPDGIVSSSQETTGDPLVDDGFRGSNTDAGGVERRRGDSNGQHNGQKSNAAGGGSSGGSMGGFGG